MLALLDALGIKRAGIVGQHLLVVPQLTPSAYYRAVARYGDPVAGLPVRDKADFEAARAKLHRAGC